MWTLCTRSLFCLLLSIAAWPAHGQGAPPPALDPDLMVTQYLHRHWKVEGGLPQNTVYAIEQTNDGYLWLGTQEGLVRFDGIKFTIYDKHRVDELPNHSVSVLMEDAQGRLWIGLDRGGLIRYADSEFVVYAAEDGLPEGAIRALHQDREGIIWIGTVGGGLASFDGQRFRTYTVSDGLAGDVVLAIEHDREGNLWIGTNAGLSRYQNERFENFTRADGLPGEEVRSLHTSEAGALWIGTNEGLTRFRAGEFRRFPQLDDRCNGTITDLLHDQAGSLWIATVETGVCRLLEDKVQVLTQENGLTYNNVRVLFEDRERSLWIGTDGGGLNQIRGGKFVVYGENEGLSDNAVYSVYEDREGSVWIATGNGGLNRLTNGVITAFTRQDGLSSDFILSILEDRGGTLWVGTYDGGACRRREMRFECFGTDGGLASDFVRALFEDSRGGVWIGTDAGLHRYAGGQLELYTTDDGLPSESVIALLEDQAGDLWVGTGQGLARMRGDSVLSLHTSVQALDEPILSLYEDAHGSLWIGTFGGGLYRLDDGQLTRYSTTDGLFDDTVIQILEDDAGHLWFGSNKGIARIPLRQFDAFDQGLISEFTPAVYDENDGLRSREANGGTQPAAIKDREGRLWFSTMGGAAMIDPSSITVNPIPPPVILEEVIINERLVETFEQMTFRPGSRKFEFHYTGLSFVASEGVQFQYMLEGVDETWVDAGSRREAFYTNLRPGRYRFRVRAANDDGVWSSEPAGLSFYLEPRFYQTTWFFILCVVSVLGLSIGGYRLRIRQMKARQKKLTLLVEEQTTELKTQKQTLEKLNRNLEREVQRQVDIIMKERVRYEQKLIVAKEKAEESARLKTTILTNMTHEIRTPLAAILGYSQVLSSEVAGEQKEFVDCISQNGDRLLGTLDTLLELAALESGDVELECNAINLTAIAEEVLLSVHPRARAKGVDIRFPDTGESIHVQGDEAAVRSVVTKLVDNAVKFTNEGWVEVQVFTNEADAWVSVRDTGIGIGEEFMPELFQAFKQESQGLARSYEGSGVGLAVARQLVEAMDGEIRVESEPGTGTCFTVALPLHVRNRVATQAEITS